MLTIGINGRFLASRVTGVERYASNVYQRLIPLGLSKGYQFKIFAPLEYERTTEPVDARVSLVRSKIFHGAVARHAWEQTLLPALSTLEGVDILLNMTNTAPCFFRNSVVVLHDVAWLERPEWFSSAFNLGYNLVMPLAMRNARKVITVSDYSAGEIERKLSVESSKLQVIPEGVGEEFKRVAPDMVPESLRQFDLTRPYFLHVGTVQPRKNLERLLEAYVLLYSQQPDLPPLLLAGGKNQHFSTASLQDKLKCPGIRLLGYVPDATLPYLYSNALAYVTASLYEGFGLTLLEAMACGSPVIASDIGAHKEVAGGAALFFNPGSTDELLLVMKRVCAESGLREELIAEGFQRVKRYSWDKHVSELLQTIEKCGAR
jgi:glycosyltransferase involved in cell wall biosynthesis